MGAAFFSAGTRKIRKLLHTAFGPQKIKGTANTWMTLFDPANGVRIRDAIAAMDLPPRHDPTFGPRLQERFQMLFDRMLASDTQYNTTTHNDVRKATFDALVDAKAAPSVKPIKFYVAHQSSSGPFSPQNPEFRFVNWIEEDDDGQGRYNFLLICPQLTGRIATRLRRKIENGPHARKKKKRVSKKKAKD